MSVTSAAQRSGASITSTTPAMRHSRRHEDPARVTDRLEEAAHAGLSQDDAQHPHGAGDEQEAIETELAGLEPAAEPAEALEQSGADP